MISETKRTQVDNHKQTQNEIKKASLVVAPKSLLYIWKNEAEKFKPHLKVQIYSGSRRQTLAQDSELFKNDIIITTYQTLRIDIDKFKEYPFLYFILDEAHYVKNSQAQINIVARLIQAERKIAMTGTPVEN